VTEPARILLLGEPLLRERCAPVTDLRDPQTRADLDRLRATLLHFRRQLGFGRAIAAPQIGVSRRVVALELAGAPHFLVNPELTWRSPETFTLWDDCLSFPFLMVRVRRHAALALRYLDEHGEEHEWKVDSRAVSELLQHELDHLDGILAVDRALDARSLVSREVFEARRAEFAGQVDYVIGGV
jgi:peptide deformylase